MITLYEHFAEKPAEQWRRMRSCAWVSKNVRESMPVISYDFDGVLHVGLYLEPDTGKFRNLSYHDESRWAPFEAMHEQLREEAKSASIVVVTARPWGSLAKVVQFCRQYDLPVAAVFGSMDAPKRGILTAIGASRHYDDRDMTAELAGSGVEFVQIDPRESGATFGDSADDEQMAIAVGERS